MVGFNAFYCHSAGRTEEKYEHRPMRVCGDLSEVQILICVLTDSGGSGWACRTGVFQLSGGNY